MTLTVSNQSGPVCELLDDKGNMVAAVADKPTADKIATAVNLHDHLVAALHDHVAQVEADLKAFRENNQGDPVWRERTEIRLKGTLERLQALKDKTA